MYCFFSLLFGLFSVWSGFTVSGPSAAIFFR